MQAHEEQATFRPLRAGLVAGAATAIAASLVQLPLRSPSDVLFNSASVALGSLIAGALAGVTWGRLSSAGLRPLRFWAVWTAVAGLALLLSLAGNTLLGRTFAYVWPLVAIVFAATGALTPFLARRPELGNAWLVALAVMAAIGVGAGLVAMGDAPSGRLELPPRDG